MPYITGSYSFVNWWAPQKQKYETGSLLSRRCSMNLAPIGFGTEFLDFEDFAVNIIGKVAENFITALSISWTKLSMFFLISVVINWRVSVLNLW